MGGLHATFLDVGGMNYMKWATLGFSRVCQLRNCLMYTSRFFSNFVPYVNTAYNQNSCIVRRWLLVETVVCELELSKAGLVGNVIASCWVGLETKSRNAMFSALSIGYFLYNNYESFQWSNHLLLRFWRLAGSGRSLACCLTHMLWHVT